MKKRILALALVIVMGIGSSNIVRANVLDELQTKISNVLEITEGMLSDLKDEMEKTFRDTKKSSWYADHVAKILGINGIDGYPDGTFQPNGTITRAEFTKILITSLYGEQEKTNTQWASGYFDKAEKEGILSKNEFALETYNNAITRQEMAKMISLAAEKKLGEGMADNLADIEKTITDAKGIDSGYKNHVLSAYSKGIITGYPDGSFGAKKTATRAEASAMLIRLLDKREREELDSGYNTVESLGLKEEPKSNYGDAFYTGLNETLSPINNVVFIKKSDLPLKIGYRVLHDIKLSTDKKHILIIQENLEYNTRMSLWLSVKGNTLIPRNSVDYYEKELENGKYQTTHYISSIADDIPITLDMIEYITFIDATNGTVIALEKGELFK